MQTQIYLLEFFFFQQEEINTTKCEGVIIS